MSGAPAARPGIFSSGIAAVPSTVVPARTTPLPSRLVIETGQNAGMIFPLRESVVSIGRGPENTIQIIDTRMSRRHSLLLLNGEAWFARDLESKNGTLVNELPIDGDQVLRHGDRLQVGDTTFIFEQEELAGGEPVQPKAAIRVLQDEGTVVPSHVLKLREEQPAPGTPPAEAASPDQHHLAALYQISEMTSSILDLDELLERVLDLIQQFLSPDCAAILLYDERHDVLLPKVTRRPPKMIGDIVISNSVIARATGEHAALLVSDAARDARFKAAESIVMQRIQSAICAPLVCKNEVLGVLYLDRRLPKSGYGEADLRLVVGIANQSAVAIANSRLHMKLLEQHAREMELEIARSIQEGLLPATMPELPGFEICGVSRPAKMVGGDYFDVIALEDGRYILAIADVSGKGVPAAILLASVRAAVQVETRGLKTEQELLAVMERLNQMVWRDTAGNMFVTMVLGLLDPARRRLAYCNAGHVYPLLCHAGGRIDTLATGGCFLGVIPGYAFELGEAELPAGASLIFYTDGVTDMMNPQREMFGQQRLNDFVVTAGGLSARDFCQHLEEAAKFYRNGAEPFDDFTVMVLKSTA